MPDFTYIQDALAIKRRALMGFVGEDAVKKAVTRNRIETLQRGWYAWKSLPERWREDVQAFLGYNPAENAQQLSAEQKIVSLLRPVQTADREALESFRIETETLDTATGEVINLPTTGIPRAKLIEYMKQAQWLDLLARLDKKAISRMGLGNTRRKPIEEIYVPAMLKHNVGLPKSYPRLLRMEKQYKSEGATCVISKKLGMKNRLKITDEQLDYIISLAGDARKPSDSQVWQWYNEKAMEEGWPRVSSVRTIQRHMNRPDVLPVIVMARDGYDEWKKHFSYQISTLRPSARSLMWVADGTKVNYFYRLPGKKHRMARLAIYAVMDVYSEYFLGWFIGREENYKSVRDAARMAVEAAGEVPYQFLYDGDSANTKFFGQGWVGLHFAAQPYNGQSKAIESAFNRLQNQVMRDRPFFTGQNITAKSTRSRANLDLIDQLERSGQLPTEEEAMAAAEQDLRLWNHSPKKHLGGLTPAEAWEQSVCPEPRSLTTATVRDLFWEWNEDRGYLRSITYTSSGLLMKHQGVELRYEVQNTDGAPDADFHRRHIGQRFHVKYDPQAPEAMAALYLHPEDKDYLQDPSELRYVADAVSKTHIERAVYDHQPGTRSNLEQRLQFKKLQAQQASEKYRKAQQVSLDADQLAAHGHRLRMVDKSAIQAAEAEVLEGKAQQKEEPVKPNEIQIKRPTDITTKKYKAYKDEDFGW